jgi:hypothetical protein
VNALLLALVAWTPICEMDSVAADAYILDLHRTHATFEQRLAAIAKHSVGTPYADGPLGEGPDGRYDSDPLIDMSRADCVTFMEQSIAFAAGLNYEHAFDLLQEIRYKDGVIDFEHRNHFFVADWIENNPFCVEVTDDLDVPTRPIKRTISRRDFFERVNAPGLGTDTPDRVETLSIIPSQHVADAEMVLPSPSIVVFVGKVEWLFALHTGLYIRDDDGSGRLYHASSRSGEVVAADLTEYVEEQGGRYLGIAVYRITAPSLDR